MTTGNSNTALGDEAGSNLVDGEGNIYIGAQVQAGNTDETQFIRIGNDTAFAFPYDTFIAGIFDRAVDVGTAAFVYVDNSGKLGTIPVDAHGNKVATPQAMLNESRNQQKRIAELEGTVARLAAMVKEQAAQIQKVSARVEVNKPAPNGCEQTLKLRNRVALCAKSTEANCKGVRPAANAPNDSRSSIRPLVGILTPVDSALFPPNYG